MQASPLIENPELEGGAFYWPGGPNGILLMHGFTATSVEIRPLAHAFQQAGFSVAGPLLPGHGTTPDDLNAQRWQNWVAAADQAYQLLASNCARVFVGGESLGGLLTLYLASRHPEINGILLFAPAMKVKNLWRTWFARFFITTRLKKPGSGPPNPLPWQGYKVFPVKGSYQLWRFQKQVGKRLSLVTQPALIFQGKKDRTILPVSSQIIFEGIRSKQKELVWLENSGHCVLLAPEHEQVITQSRAFVEAILQEHGVYAS
jgi:carboxylesterase